jgi:O-antigen/teichoic acid export membrane protein
VKFRELTAFAGWSAVSGVVSPLLIYVDRFMVGVVQSTTAVTYYAAPFELIARLVLIPAGIVGALYPAFSQLSGQRDRQQAERLAASSVNLVIVLLAPVAVLLLGGARDILTLWLGPAYADRSALALQLLALGVVVNAAAHVPFGLLQSIGRPDIPARFHLLELPIHLALAWFLIARFGVAGAALAWTARMLIDAALLFRAAARLDLLRARALQHANLRISAGTLVIAASTAVLSSVLLQTPCGRLTAAGILAGASAAWLWFYAVPANERRHITSVFHNVAARQPATVGVASTPADAPGPRL